MLARITGVLEEIGETGALIALESGLAYRVLTPRFLTDDLMNQVGQRVTLYTRELYEAQGQGGHLTPRLMGFSSSNDLRFFELMTTVKGVGPRKALRAMAAPIPTIAAAITTKDAKALQQLPEIGKRLAETMIAELHGKIESFTAAEGASARLTEPKDVLTGAAEQARAALVQLGESPAEADRMVRGTMDREPGLNNADAILAAAFGQRE